MEEKNNFIYAETWHFQCMETDKRVFPYISARIYVTVVQTKYKGTFALNTNYTKTSNKQTVALKAIYIFTYIIYQCLNIYTYPSPRHFLSDK